MPDEIPPPPVTASPARAKVVHQTPLKPGSDWHPQKNGAMPDDLAKRIAGVKIVGQRPAKRRMHLVAAELVTGAYTVLYLGDDPLVADKTAKAFDPGVHSAIYRYNERAMPRVYSAPRPKTIHHSPLLGGESIAQMQARLANAVAPSPADPKEEFRKKIEARGRELGALAPEALKAAALKAGFNADELSQLPEDEIENEAIEFILEQEFKEEAVRLGIHPAEPNSTPNENGVDSGAPASTTSTPASESTTADLKPDDANAPAKPASSLANPKKK